MFDFKIHAKKNTEVQKKRQKCKKDRNAKKGRQFMFNFKNHVEKNKSAKKGKNVIN